MAEQATRDWHTRAIIQVLEDVTCHNAAFQKHTYLAGEVVEMVQWGRQGREIDRAWWSDFDIDLAFIIDGTRYKVEVIKIIEEEKPN